MHSFNDIFNEFVVRRELLDYLPIHTLSQDHLEQMFGDMRAFNGSNNNPNVVQFRAGLRKVLANTTVCPSKKRNCTILNPSSVYNPYSNISTITSRRPKSLLPIEPSMDITPDDVETILKELSEINVPNIENSLIDLSDLTTAHIALRIECEIETKISCELCKNIFHEND